VKDIITPYADKSLIEAGCDEAGRGCLAGPVVAAAVILPKDFRHPFLNDSKQLSEKRRNQLRVIIENEAISFGIGIASPFEIDQINILNASFLAMHRAIDKLNFRPEHLMIDGNRFHPYQGIPHSCIIRGDSKFLHIAAASILAKTYRDEHMEILHHDYPHYKWSNNKGYPTEEHRKAIKRHGDCVHHRQSFTLLAAEQLSLFD
jgi:ribonuclease HII